jgi:nicotinate-nucleotide pyrophosphorylase (carboxylating)
MLDNMSSALMIEAVALINKRTKIEASGNMTLKRIRKVASTGVDYISIGALTHSVKALDISQRIID